MILTREAVTDEEFQAAAALRAVSFYAYPPERAFAGKVGLHVFDLYIRLVEPVKRALKAYT